LGTALFTRTSRSMRLTREGEILHTAAHESLEVLSRALLRIKRLENRQQIRVSASPSLAAKWLVPRLERFLAEHPGADVRVDVSHSTLSISTGKTWISPSALAKANTPGLRLRPPLPGQGVSRLQSADHHKRKAAENTP
jgi:hypothetical protein